MSGHSKWSQIKRQKGVSDNKRGQAFTKLANAITLAVRQGGGVADPASNFRLRLMVEKARAINMPKENIERAIARASGKQANEMESIVYEGFAPGGVGVIIEATTDNKMRTGPEIKNCIEKNGGTMAAQGAVSYQFEQKGVIMAEKNGKSLDDIFLLAADAGAEDVEEVGEEVLIYTKPEDLAKVRDGLGEGIKVTEAELTRKPTISVQIEDGVVAQKVIAFIDKLESLDDVQKVYANFDISEDIMKTIN